MLQVYPDCALCAAAVSQADNALRANITASMHNTYDRSNSSTSSSLRPNTSLRKIVFVARSNPRRLQFLAYSSPHLDQLRSAAQAVVCMGLCTLRRVSCKLTHRCSPQRASVHSILTLLSSVRRMKKLCHQPAAPGLVFWLDRCFTASSTELHRLLEIVRGYFCCFVFCAWLSAGSVFHLLEYVWLGLAQGYRVLPYFPQACK